ncbi:hypothetical protein LSAT2_030156 [Lamellibrachia satsuma]|nr:hypothetical protein LSAT2_030156 [Lamellibrachia satsuma]
MFYVCKPIGYLKYRKHHMTCGDLWWHQDIHSCERSPQPGCDDTAPAIPYTAPSTTGAPCPYEPVPNQDGYFRSVESPDEIQQCIAGMVFQDPPCGCVQLTEITPTCRDDLLLHFPYEDHYNDVTCHHAIATQYGSDVRRTFDAVRNSNVACFGGNSHFEVSFLRTWFAENSVDRFSVAVWFQILGPLSLSTAIVNNVNCEQSAGFSIARSDREVLANMTAGGGELTVRSPLVADNMWHHVAWVYDGQRGQLYVDGVLSSQAPASGFMQNKDVAMHIADNCDVNGFIGCMDEVTLL